MEGVRRVLRRSGVGGVSDGAGGGGRGGRVEEEEDNRGGYGKKVEVQENMKILGRLRRLKTW